jgi:PemK-like, MazF-like toxin of type II toxin-antitoxin system
MTVSRFEFDSAADAWRSGADSVSNIVAFISSRTFSTDSSAEHAVGSTDAEFATTGLKNPSLIRLNKLTTLHRGLVRRRIGRIGPATQRAVARGLRYVFEI